MWDAFCRLATVTVTSAPVWVMLAWSTVTDATPGPDGVVALATVEAAPVSMELMAETR